MIHTESNTQEHSYMTINCEEVRTKERGRKTKGNKKSKILPGRAVSQQDTEEAKVPQFSPLTSDPVTEMGREGLWGRTGVLTALSGSW